MCYFLTWISALRIGNSTTLAIIVVFSASCSTVGLTDKEKDIPEINNDIGLRVSIISPDEKAQLGDVISLHLILHNTGDLPAAFLPINSAFERPLYADVFDVTLLGESLPYIGLKARRLVVAEDVLELAPDERLEQTVDLSDYYQMDRPGTYEIRYVPRPVIIGSELQIELTDVVVDTPVVYITLR